MLLLLVPSQFDRKDICNQCTLRMEFMLHMEALVLLQHGKLNSADSNIESNIGQNSLLQSSIPLHSWRS